jgi:hypothetical protein
MYLETIRFFDFLLYVYIENQWPRGGGNSDPRAITWTILLEVHYTMFHAQYLTSSICQLLEILLLVFTI